MCVWGGGGGVIRSSLTASTALHVYEKMPVTDNEQGRLIGLASG